MGAETNPCRPRCCWSLRPYLPASRTMRNQPLILINGQPLAFCYSNLSEPKPQILLVGTRQHCLSCGAPPIPHSVSSSLLRTMVTSESISPKSPWRVNESIEKGALRTVVRTMKAAGYFWIIFFAPTSVWGWHDSV